MANDDQPQRDSDTGASRETAAEWPLRGRQVEGEYVPGEAFMAELRRYTQDVDLLSGLDAEWAYDMIRELCGMVRALDPLRLPLEYTPSSVTTTVEHTLGVGDVSMSSDAFAELVRLAEVGSCTPYENRDKADPVIAEAQAMLDIIGQE